MDPLRITFTLDAPMATPDRPIYLDGLLGWSVASQGQADGLTSQQITEAVNSMPIEKHHCGDSWVYQASALIAESTASAGTMFYTRRYDMATWAKDKVLNRWEGNKNVIPIGTGPKKAFVLHQNIHWSDKIHAWIVGDKAFITEALGRIHHIGKSRRLGLGRIANTSIQDDPDALHLWRHRVLPMNSPQATPGHIAVTSSLRPPYWDRSQWQPALEFVN